MPTARLMVFQRTRQDGLRCASCCCDCFRVILTSFSHCSRASLSEPAHRQSARTGDSLAARTERKPILSRLWATRIIRQCSMRPLRRLLMATGRRAGNHGHAGSLGYREVCEMGFVPAGSKSKQRNNGMNEAKGTVSDDSVKTQLL